MTFLRQNNCLAMSRHLSYFCHFAADPDGYRKGNVIMFLRKQQRELASLHPVEFLPARYSISVRLVVLLPSLDLLLTQLNSCSECASYRLHVKNLVTSPTVIQ